MRKRLILYLVLILGAGLYGWFLISEQTSEPIKLNKPAPDFSLLDETAGSVNFAEYRGRWVLLHFWATWCGPCLQEIPSLNILQKKFSENQFLVLGVAVETNIEDIQAFREKAPILFKVLLDPQGEVAEKYGTHRLPESYLISPTGIVIEKMIGSQIWSSPSWEQKIRGYLAE